MMIRALTVSLLFAVLAVPAYAQDSGTAPVADPAPQDNPQTRQTDPVSYTHLTLPTIYSV